jgi:hypothetical protein
LAQQGGKTGTFSGLLKETGKAASNGRRMTFIRDGVGDIYLTHNIKMDMQA